MNFYYVDEDGNLTPLVSFTIREGQSHVVPIPVIGGTVFGRSKREPDTFRLVSSSMLPQVGNFRVVSSDCTVYGCIGSSVGVEHRTLVVSGVIHDRYEVESQHRAEAEAQMRAASSAR